MWERISGYWGTRLPGDFTTLEVLGLLAGAFCATALSVVTLHAFIPEAQPVVAVIQHAMGVGFTYTVTFAAMIAILYGLKISFPSFTVSVWQLWLLSLLVYVAGFFLSPVGDLLTGDIKYKLHADLTPENQDLHFLRLTPVWAVITWFFVLVLEKRSLEAELIRLTQLNQRLGNEARKPASTEPRLEIPSGKQTIKLTAGDITHVSVDDHYCSIHTDTGNRHDVALPLRDLSRLLPDNFVQVHRSHLVNIEKVVRVDRRDRSHQVIVGKKESAVPVSRSRLRPLLDSLESSHQGLF